MSPAASAETIVAALCAERPVLAELRAMFPGAWDKVYGELTGLAGQQDPARIAASLTVARLDWRQSQPRCLSLRQKFNEKLAAECGYRLIRKLALEQYSRAVQQETLKAAGTAGIRDRLLFRLLILPLAFAPRALPYRLHSLAWRLLGNRAAAAARLMQAGCYLIAPAELIVNLRSLIGSRQALEIGAGRGILAACLRRAGVAMTAVDDGSWADTVPLGAEVLRLDGREALVRFKPQVVVSCWPPPDNAFEPAIFASPEVEDYIVIVSRHRHASGNHQAYAKAKGFRCVQATGPLAQMLLPREAESVLYIFTRKDCVSVSAVPSSTAPVPP